MPTTNQFDRIGSDPSAATLLPSLAEIALSIEERRAFLNRAVGMIHKAHTGAAFTAVVRGVKGTWRTLASAGQSEEVELPYDLLSNVLDQERYDVAARWWAVPVDVPNTDSRLLIQRSEAEPLSASVAQSLAAGFAIADLIYRRAHEPARRADRLAAILDMTTRWNQSRQTDQLLEEIAQAATRLLQAERATIFLPDAIGRNLIGKPALGVEGGQIRIPAGRGVVGSVIETGQPQRVDADIASEQAQIHRDVDAELGFVTHSLLCVPLVNSRQQVIGAFELINKQQGNFSDADQQALIELAAHAAIAIENTQHVEHLEATTRVVADQAADQVQLIGQCEPIQELKTTLQRVAPTDLAILITGENGTGKEVVAQRIHYLSDRRDNALVAVNCAAITESLLESELFGHEKGAFTDAHQARAGKFELADQGTLFLDEIGDMSPGGQAKLLRVLEEMVVVRVGGSQPITTSARVIAATNQDLAQLVRQKRFREDLFFRLNVVTLHVPPLRDRGDDVILLAEHFLKAFCRRARRPILQISAAAREKLQKHAWPGNVRELRNLMERLSYLMVTDRISPQDLDFVSLPRRDESSLPMDLSLAEATRVFQCDFIQRQIDQAGGNMTEAATKLGLHRSNLYRKMRQLGMGEDSTPE